MLFRSGSFPIGIASVHASESAGALYQRRVLFATTKGMTPGTTARIAAIHIWVDMCSEAFVVDEIRLRTSIELRKY